MANVIGVSGYTTVARPRVSITPIVETTRPAAAPTPAPTPPFTPAPIAAPAAGGGADRKGITSVGSVASPVQQLGFHLNLAAVGELNPGDLHSQMRNARDPSGFLRFGNYSGHRFAPARDQQSIRDDRFDQCAGERIAGLVMIAR